MTSLEETTFEKWLMSLDLQWSAFKKQSYHIFRHKMYPLFLVRSLLILCFYQHNKQEVGSWWLGEKELSGWTTIVSIVTLSVLLSSNDDPPWWLTGVHGPQSDAEKVAFLDELREVRAGCPGPWMLAGDFNMIYCSEDKNNGNVNQAMMGRFRRFVNEMELKEIPLLGRRYTWSNERESPLLLSS